jgi:hypothetical protein
MEDPGVGLVCFRTSEDCHSLSMGGCEKLPISLGRLGIAAIAATFDAQSPRLHG